MSKTIGIVGSRRRNTSNDNTLLLAAFDRVFLPGDRIVSGGCPKGADNMAEVLARIRNIPITIHRPDWSKGKHAGLLRNLDIARDCDVLLALAHPSRTGGTEDTIRKALALKKKVYLVLDESSLDSII